MPEEFRPYLIYRADQGKANCATWRLEQGFEALALFFTRESAEAYRAANLDSAWEIYQPATEQLAQIMATCEATGIVYAVLDPDGGQARRIFSIGQIMTEIRRTSGEA